jgi:hypothetical protein
MSLFSGLKRTWRIYEYTHLEDRKSSSVSATCRMSASIRKRLNCCVAAKCRDVPFAKECIAAIYNRFRNGRC